MDLKFISNLLRIGKQFQVRLLLHNAHVLDIVAVTNLKSLIFPCGIYAWAEKIEKPVL